MLTKQINALNKELAKQQFISNYPNTIIYNIQIIRPPFDISGSPKALGMGSERNKGVYLIYYDYNNKK